MMLNSRGSISIVLLVAFVGVWITIGSTLPRARWRVLNREWAEMLRVP